MRLFLAIWLAIVGGFSLVAISEMPDGCVPITKSYWDCP